MLVDKPAARVYLAEEQQLLLEAYRSGLTSAADITLVGASSEVTGAALIRATRALKPDVVVVGTGTLQEGTVEQLRELRREAPGVGLVVLSYAYDVKTNAALREFSRRAPGGCAYLLKHTIGEIDQLVQVILAVASGRIIMDPGVMGELVTVAEQNTTGLRNLSPREMEVLGWMARAYRNEAIARILHLEPKTVERHINNIYGKIGGCPDAKHPRVHAIGLFMRAAGYGVRSEHGHEAGLFDDPLGAPPAQPPQHDRNQAPARTPTFQQTTPARKTMDGPRSTAGTSHATSSGARTLAATSIPGRS